MPAPGKSKNSERKGSRQETLPLTWSAAAKPDDLPLFAQKETPVNRLPITPRISPFKPGERTATPSADASAPSPTSAPAAMPVAAPAAATETPAAQPPPATTATSPAPQAPAAERTQPIADTAVPAPSAPTDAVPAPSPAPRPTAAKTPSVPATPQAKSNDVTPAKSPLRPQPGVKASAADRAAPRPAAPTAAAAGKPEAAAGSATAAARPAAKPLAIGRKLREAREKLQLSLAQVSQKTKIPKDFLEKAEDNDAAAFPPAVYTKSYLRQLCREYGLDAAAVLKEYQESLEAGSADASANQLVLTSEDHETGAKVGYLPRSQTEEPKPMNKLSPTMIAVGAVVVVLLALVLIVVAVNHGKRSAGAETTIAGVDKSAKVDMESFITPQQLPLKELPVPNR